MSAAALEAAHLIALARLPRIGPATLLRCQADGDLARQWSLIRRGRAADVPALAVALGPHASDRRDRAGALAMAARGIEVSGLLAAHELGGHQVLVRARPGDPARLAEDPSPPAVLFAEGRVDISSGPTVAMVGTRNATRGGRELASAWAAELAAVGVAVVSGLALGIDGAAHAGALRSAPGGSGPIGVVAAGLDIAYPRRHLALHRQVAAAGLLISETPLGVRPTPWRFPARNRIIAALADAVVVVESRASGGSMLTAAEALARDVPVLAVPGHPSSPASAGTNDLLAEGAELARDVDDVLVAIGLGGARGPDAPRVPRRGGGPAPEVSREAAAVLAAFGAEPLALPEVLRATGLDLETCASGLAELETDGLVVRSGAWFERTADPAGPSSTRGAGA